MVSRSAFAALFVATLLAYSELPGWLKKILVPPPLPSSFASLSIAPLDLHPPVESKLVRGAAPFTEELAYCEDATEWTTSEGKTYVLISCDRNRKAWNTVMGPLSDPTPRGTLWIVDPEAEEPEGSPIQLINFPTECDFHPLGIEVFSPEPKDALSPLLYLVNHQRRISTVELFILTPPSFNNPAKASYLRTIKHPSFTGAPNSFAAISATTFYLTHDHRFNRRGTTLLPKILNVLETFLALPISRVDLVSIDGGDVSVRTVAKGISFANGIALSHSGGTLAVASTTGFQVLLYSRNKISNELAFEEAISVPFHVDNLSVAPREFTAGDGVGEEDVFIAAGHPHFFSLAAVARNRTLAPNATHPSSWVVAISPRHDTASGVPDDGRAPYPSSKRAAASATWELTTLFQSSGRTLEDGGFGMSTTGVVGRSAGGRKWLLVTGLYAEGVRLLRDQK